MSNDSLPSTMNEDRDMIKILAAGSSSHKLLSEVSKTKISEFRHLSEQFLEGKKVPKLSG